MGFDVLIRRGSSRGGSRMDAVKKAMLEAGYVSTSPWRETNPEDPNTYLMMGQRGDGMWEEVIVEMGPTPVITPVL